jgi:spermidine synthase
MITDRTLEYIEITQNIESLYIPLQLSEKSKGQYDIVKQESHTILLENLQVIMSDSNYEKMANYNFIENVTGDVLIAGLGLGLIIKAIEDKSDVSSITVIEISPDIIDMVEIESNFNSKVTIINKSI